MPSTNGCRESSSSPDHIVIGIAEAGFVETHARGEPAENLGIRQRFAGRWKRRPRELQIVVAVGEIKIGVFEKRRRRQHDIGEIGGVGLELLQNDGEQVVAPQPAPNRCFDPAQWRRDSSCRPPELSQEGRRRRSARPRARTY